MEITLIGVQVCWVAQHGMPRPRSQLQKLAELGRGAGKCKAEHYAASGLESTATTLLAVRMREKALGPRR